jgi:hypothetical protein
MSISIHWGLGVLEGNGVARQMPNAKVLVVPKSISPVSKLIKYENKSKPKIFN